MGPDEEAVCLAALILLDEGISIKVTSLCINMQLKYRLHCPVKGEDLMTIVNAAGIKENQYHSDFTAVLEKVKHPWLTASLCVVLMFNR